MLLSKVFAVSFLVKFSPIGQFFTSLKSFICFISTTAKSISKYFYPKLDARCSLTGQRKNFSTFFITKTKVKQKEIRKGILKNEKISSFSNRPVFCFVYSLAFQAFVEGKKRNFYLTSLILNALLWIENKILNIGSFYLLFNRKKKEKNGTR